jgi:hypothetical protein
MRLLGVATAPNNEMRKTLADLFQAAAEAVERRLQGAGAPATVLLNRSVVHSQGADAAGFGATQWPHAV